MWRWSSIDLLLVFSFMKTFDEQKPLLFNILNELKETKAKIDQTKENVAKAKDALWTTAGAGVVIGGACLPAGVMIGAAGVTGVFITSIVGVISEYFAESKVTNLDSEFLKTVNLLINKLKEAKVSENLNLRVVEHLEPNAEPAKQVQAFFQLIRIREQLNLVPNMIQKYETFKLKQQSRCSIC